MFLFIVLSIGFTAFGGNSQASEERELVYVDLPGNRGVTHIIQSSSQRKCPDGMHIGEMTKVESTRQAGRYFYYLTCYTTQELGRGYITYLGKIAGRKMKPDGTPGDSFCAPGYAVGEPFKNSSGVASLVCFNPDSIEEGYITYAGAGCLPCFFSRGFENNDDGLAMRLCVRNGYHGTFWGRFIDLRVNPEGNLQVKAKILGKEVVNRNLGEVKGGSCPY